MKRIFSYWTQAISKSFRRFAVTNIVALAFALSIIVVYDYGSGFGEFERTMFFLGMMLPISAMMHLLSERLRIHPLLLQLIGFVPTAIYAYTVPNMEFSNLYRTCGMLAVALLLVIFVPYFRRGGDLGRHIFELMTGFFLSFFVSLVLMGGISFILVTIDTLFGVEIDFDVYRNLATILFSFVWPVHFLGYYPEKDVEPRKVAFLYRLLLLYVLLPLMIIYTVILYVYFIKLLFERNFPDNMMAPLVSWYLICSVGTIFFSQSIDEETRGEFARWARAAVPYFAASLIAPILVLIYSVWVRIATYGYTVPRYWLAMIAVFSLVFVGIVLLMWKRSRMQHIVFACLILFTLVATMGYFSAYDVSLRSQIARLDRYIEIHGLNRSEIFDHLDELTFEQRRELSDRVTYIIYDLEHPLDFVPDEPYWAVENRILNGGDPGGYSGYQTTWWSEYVREASSLTPIGENRWLIHLYPVMVTSTHSLEDNVLLVCTGDKVSLQIEGEPLPEEETTVDLREMMLSLDLEAEQIVEQWLLANGRYRLTFVPDSISKVHKAEGDPGEIDYYMIILLIERLTE